MGFLGIGKKNDGAAAAATDGQAKKPGFLDRFKKKGGGTSASSSAASYGNGTTTTTNSRQHCATVNGKPYYSHGFFNVGVRCEKCGKPAEAMFMFRGSEKHYACGNQKHINRACEAAITEHNSATAA